MAKKGIGTTISINATSIGGLTNIKPPERTADTMEIKILDSTDGYKGVLRGFKDGGEVELTGYYDTAYTGHDSLETAYENGTEDTYVITFPFGVTLTFTGLITKLISPGEANTDDPVPFEITIKVIGKPVLGTTASTGLSDLTLSGSGTLSPAAAAGTLYYSYVFDTAESITVTVTAASHTIKLFVDDVYIEDLTSGEASSAIAFSAGESKKIVAIAYEDDCLPKIYTIVAARTS